MTHDATPAQTRNRKAWKLILAIAVALVVLNVFYPFVWFSTEFRARVVDESTGRPVSGAIVLANWELVGGIVEENLLGQLAISEVVTGTDGDFRIPAWGPRFVLGLGHLATTEPKIRILSPNYSPFILNNQPRPMMASNYGRADMVIHFLYQDQDLKLKPRSTDLHAYDQALDYLRLELSFIYYGRNCEWRSAPRTLAFIHNRKRELSQHHRGAQLYYVNELGNQTHCGDPSPVKLSREYLQ